MSVCQVCQLEMTIAYSCICVAVKIRNANGRVVTSLDPIRSGDERRYRGVVRRHHRTVPPPHMELRQAAHGQD